jgi:hypothetical protein
MEYDRLTVSSKLQNVVDNTEPDDEEVKATIEG